MLRDPDDYHAYYIPMPCRIRGLVSMDENCYPSVYINSRLSREMQRRALFHELKHIERGDPYNTLSIHEVEGRAS